MSNELDPNQEWYSVVTSREVTKMIRGEAIGKIVRPTFRSVLLPEVEAWLEENVGFNTSGKKNWHWGYDPEGFRFWFYLEKDAAFFKLVWG